jgi:hypothetical protein
MCIYLIKTKKISNWKKFADFRPGSGSGFGSGSGSAFVSKPRSGLAYNECGSKTLTIRNPDPFLDHSVRGFPNT